MAESGPGAGGFERCRGRRTRCGPGNHEDAFASRHVRSGRRGRQDRLVGRLRGSGPGEPRAGPHDHALPSRERFENDHRRGGGAPGRGGPARPRCAGAEIRPRLSGEALARDRAPARGTRRRDPALPRRRSHQRLQQAVPDAGRRPENLSGRCAAVPARHGALLLELRVQPPRRGRRRRVREGLPDLPARGRARSARHEPYRRRSKPARHRGARAVLRDERRQAGRQCALHRRLIQVARGRNAGYRRRRRSPRFRIPEARLSHSRRRSSSSLRRCASHQARNRPDTRGSAGGS